MNVKIFHNPRCSKSRQTLELLQNRGINPQIINYLQTPPTDDEITDILKKLNLSLRDLIRTGESVYKELKLDQPGLTDDQLLNAIAANPILLQRPIVINGAKAAIGRPPENVLTIL